MKKYSYFFLAILVILSFLLGSCKKNSYEESNANKMKKLPDNVVLQLKDTELKYKTLNNGKLNDVNINIDGEIRFINKPKEFLIYSKVENFDTTLTIIKNENEFSFKVNGIIEKIWTNDFCDKILYKVNNNNEFIDYYIIDLNNKENKKLNDKIIVSGDVINFLNNNTLILYGANATEKISGIYTYDLQSDKYSLLQPIKKAFVDYIKVLDKDKILFGKSSLDNKKECYLYNVNNKEVQLISSDVKTIKSALFIDGKVYFTGIANESSKLSLYSLNIGEKKLKRLTFDFPANIDGNSNLIYENGEIVFVGYNESEKNENVYAYDLKNKSIKLISDIESKYIII